MKNFNLVYKIKNEKNCEKRCDGSSVNGICFNKIKFLNLLPSCKSVHPLQRFNLKKSSRTYIWTRTSKRDLKLFCSLRMRCPITTTFCPKPSVHFLLFKASVPRFYIRTRMRISIRILKISM